MHVQPHSQLYVTLISMRSCDVTKLKRQRYIRIMSVNV